MFSVISAGEIKVAVKVEVVRRELGNSHDGLFAVVLDDVHPHLLLGLTNQTFLQAGDHLALRVDVLEEGKAPVTAATVARLREELNSTPLIIPMTNIRFKAK